MKQKEEAQLNLANITHWVAPQSSTLDSSKLKYHLVYVYWIYSPFRFTVEYDLSSTTGKQGAGEVQSRRIFKGKDKTETK